MRGTQCNTTQSIRITQSTTDVTAGPLSAQLHRLGPLALPWSSGGGWPLPSSRQNNLLASLGENGFKGSHALLCKGSGAEASLLWLAYVTSS